MDYKYFNQYWYNDPYPAPNGYEDKTIATSGCGPTSAAMVVSSLTPYQCDPVTMAQFAVEVGARVPGGTDMNILAPAVCKRFGLTYKTTNNDNVLLQHLQSGGMAICLAGVAQVFANSGHYIVAAYCDGPYVAIMDSANYAGKYNKTGRKGRVDVDGSNFVYCDISVLAEDSSAYWLFKKPEEVAFNAAVDKLVSKGIISSADYWKKVIAVGAGVRGEWMAAVIQGMTGKPTLQDAVAVLIAAGIVGKPDYWLANCQAGQMVQAAYARIVIENGVAKLGI